MKTDKNVMKFIRIVRRYPTLWRKEEKDFNNKDVRKQLYGCIARESGFTEDFCRRKLKSLKDRMRGTCRRLPRTKTGELVSRLGDSVVTWPYFHHMLFMSGQFLTASRAKSANTPTPTSSSGVALCEDDPEPEEELEDNIESEVEMEDDSLGRRERGGGGDSSPETNYGVSRGRDDDRREEATTTTLLIHPTTTPAPDYHHSLITPSSPSPTPISSSSSARGEKRPFRVVTVDDIHILKTESRADSRHISPNNHTNPNNTYPNHANTSHTNANGNNNMTYDRSMLDDIFTPPPISRHPGDDTDSLRHKARDMWDAFAVDITNDLHLVTDPLLQIETKAKVRRIVEQAAQQQLAKIQRQSLSSSSHYHQYRQPSSGCGDNTVGMSSTTM